MTRVKTEGIFNDRINTEEELHRSLIEEFNRSLFVQDTWIPRDTIAVSSYRIPKKLLPFYLLGARENRFISDALFGGIEGQGYGFVLRLLQIYALEHAFGLLEEPIKSSFLDKMLEKEYLNDLMYLPPNDRLSAVLDDILALTSEDKITIYQPASQITI